MLVLRDINFTYNNFVHVPVQKNIVTLNLFQNTLIVIS